MPTVPGARMRVSGRLRVGGGRVVLRWRSVRAGRSPRRASQPVESCPGCGGRGTPITAQERAEFHVWGVNGNCDIPGTATGIASNVTTVRPTSSTYLTVFPADGIAWAAAIERLLPRSYPDL